MALSIHTQPTCEPLTLEELRSHCWVTDHADDSDLEALATAARIHIETAVRRQIVQATLRLTLDRFPPGVQPLLLPRPPLQSVTSITYVDGDGVTQTWASTNYIVDTYSEPGRITPVYGVVWPIARLQAQSVNVVYVAGYSGTATTDAAKQLAVPQNIKAVVKMLTKHWFDNARAAAGEGRQDSIPLAFDSLLQSIGYGSYTE